MTDAPATQSSSVPTPTAQNFNPITLMQRLEALEQKIMGGIAAIEGNAPEYVGDVADFVSRLEALEFLVQKNVEKLASIIEVFSPFLPAPVGTALQEIPELLAEVAKVKDFVNTSLAQVETLIGKGGVGSAQSSGAVDPSLNAQVLP